VTHDRPKGAGDNDLPSEDPRKLVRDIDELLRDSNRLREPVRAASCVSCGVTGRVDVTAFRWNGERQLTWVCHACSHTWTMPERRSQDRS
jgi:hypothetical protein